VSGSRDVPVNEMFFVIVAEFTRARAAARRYDDLRYRSACQEGIAAAGLPRRIFEEFYKGSEDAAAVPQRPTGLLSSPARATGENGERMSPAVRPS
jgi:hypothetical protein